MRLFRWAGNAINVCVAYVYSKCVCCGRRLQKIELYYLFVCMYMCRYVCVHVCMYVGMKSIGMQVCVYACLYVCKVCMYIIDLSHLSQSQKLQNFLTSDNYDPPCFLFLCSPLTLYTFIESTYLFVSFLALWSYHSTRPTRGMLLKPWNREEIWCVEAPQKNKKTETLKNFCCSWYEGNHKYQKLLFPTPHLAKASLHHKNNTEVHDLPPFFWSKNLQKTTSRGKKAAGGSALWKNKKITQVRLKGLSRWNFSSRFLGTFPTFY